MRLKQLKLAGFKSFAPPTVIPFPSQLVAVVGPNGCGKSNIIDAVRWVMGESSAKNLRGGSMADVIFNGALNRKPIGQASVELVFDNSMGRFGGQYASYAEMAIKRVITRDGESAYFLNGARCRRRDVSDIFLGTGVGTRGYAIIGQDMIMRIIEARPEELRVYLEEAAGVSKYKERRRETVQRINNTRENLERVNDIREELAKQLARLERQAKTATRYKQLKEQARDFEAQILALKWSSLDQEYQAIRQQLRQASLQYEHHQSALASFEKKRTLQQAIMDDGNRQLQVVQAQYYQTGNDITRLQASIEEHQREKQRLTESIGEAKSDWEAASNQLLLDKETLQKNNRCVGLLQESLASIQQDIDTQLQQLNEKQHLATKSEERWQAVQASKNRAHHDVQVAALKLEHSEERRQTSLARIETLQDERASQDTERLQHEINRLVDDESRFADEHQVQTDYYEKAVALLAQLRKLVAANDQHIKAAERNAQHLITRHATLVATQQAAIKTKNTASDAGQWQNHSRVIDGFTVEDKWLNACEIVLDECLHGIVLNSPEELDEILLNINDHTGLFVTCDVKPQNTSRYPRLVDKMEGIIPYWAHNMDNIFAAESMTQALQWLPTLTKEQSVMTVDGDWLGSGWIRLNKSNPVDESGLIARKKAIANLDEKIQAAKAGIDCLQAQSDTLQNLLSDAMLEVDTRKDVVMEKQQAQQRCKITRQQKEQVLTNNLTRDARLNEEMEGLEQALATMAEEQHEAQIKIEAAQLQCQALDEQEAHLLQKKNKAVECLASCKHQMKATRALLHQTEIKYNREVHQVEQLNEQIKRESERSGALLTRLDNLNKRFETLKTPNSGLNLSLEEKINHYNELESSLKCWQEQVETAKLGINDLNTSCKKEAQQARALQDEMQQQQLLAEAVKTRITGLLESLTESGGQTPQDILSQIEKNITLEQREQDLHAVHDKIKQIGAINLVAIEEYQTELQRMQHLDEQYTDLTEALGTLEQAISKMDKETTVRLQRTFDEVNDSFQCLFPRLFGGGRAKLELTCDNLLEAGVLVKAQPPGKRNATIHMLSGGEKAMTAVALVFAIFQLNPAPFCMLDEVDAPLDDANVRRFSDLVKEMSRSVQFLFVTHNKVTMEMADQLIGVTMREPGVSRIVSVDIEEALTYSQV